MYTQVIKFHVRPDALADFKSAMLKDKAGTMTDPGVVEMKFFAQNDDPNILFAYERFRDEAAMQAHTAKPYVQELIAMLETSLSQPPELLKLNETKPTPDHSRTANPEDDVFVIFFIFKFKPEYRERLLKQFENHITHTNNEPGNILFDLYAIDGEDDRLVVYEHWRKESDVWDIHFKQPYAEITGALMEEAIVGDMKQYMSFVTEFGQD